MFKSIVWATDGSEVADQALSLVEELAKQGGATVTIVHVVERLEGSGGIGPPRRADEEELQEHFREVTDQLKAEGIGTTLKISGDVGVRPAHEGVRTAKEVNADLIVAGTRGRSAISGLLLGSTTHRLLHISPCPVLVVPPSVSAG